MTNSSSSTDHRQPAGIDPTVPHSARVWNYWLGGKDHFAADREVGDRMLALMPDLVDSARADRAFLGRAIRYLAGEAEVRQFLDIGTGLPTADNTHEVAQTIAPECRVVYVDNDPIVLVHARALLTSVPQGVTDYLDADVRDPDLILQAAGRTLNFDQPIALMLVGILCFVTDDEAHAIVNRLLDVVPSGSYLTIAHPTSEVHGEVMKNAVRDWNEDGPYQLILRNSDEIARFFDRIELLEPGVVSCSQWRPEPGDPHADIKVAQFCAVGRKP
ncbi:SAM-dependent methyltransferase [Frankia sp. Cas3]|uniref:SAM-dependent methyltransferase n=1 Tax=Frankia sp. Cas3 TaxID=3073926 RepID=UPI002AD1F775|nr:SAM-dependent methyltransferase [Frankia sp. Cas3]